MRINVFKSGGNSAEGGFVSNGLTLQGPLILSGPHTDHLHAVPKQYVDNAIYNLDANNITSGVLAAGRLPAFSGDATTILGSSNIILADTGVTPGSVVKPTVDAKGRVISGGSIVEADISAISFDKVTLNRPTTLNGYGITDGVPLSGNVTITGNLIQSADPVSSNQIATKHYVDAAAGLAGGISVGDIIRKPYTTTPSGFLKCNGAEVEKATYPNLYSVIGDRFANDMTAGSGKPWQHQYAFNKTQTGDVLGWSVGTGLPSLVSHCSVLATKNRVYTFGGYNATAGVSVVYTAPINADGTIGTWVAGTSLPTTLLAATTFITKNRVYLVGGATGPGSTFQTAVYTAPINSDGTIGTWTTAPSLPSAVGYHKVLVIKNRVYTFGGYNGSSYISTIYTTTINDDGTINNWSVSGTTPYAAYLMAATVIKNRVYIMGGYYGGGRRDVHYAEINADGTLGTWVAGTFLPKLASYTDCFTTNNKIHLVVDADLYSADIYSDGSLGPWYKSATMPYNMGDTRCVITGSKIYFISSTSSAGGYSNYVIYANMLGGSNDYSVYYGNTDSNLVNYSMPGSGRPWEQQYQINTTQTGDLGTWTTNATLPGNIGLGHTLVTKNRVYILGAWNSGTYTTTVYTAPINTDGTLGTWTTGTSVPLPCTGGMMFTTKNKVYINIGYNGSGYTNSLYVADINADGTIGAWNLSSVTLPVGVAKGVCFVTKNKVHVAGGYTTTAQYTGTIYTASIFIDGTISNFELSNNLPVLSYAAGVAVTKNTVYVLGGYNGSAYVNTVYYASINSDGSLGTWSTGATLPGISAWNNVFVTGNKIYVIGGLTSSTTYVNNVYHATINSDGSIGAWSTGTNLPVAIAGGYTFATKNHLYYCGGQTGNGTAVNTVYSVSILEGLNDYSPYYDGTISMPDTSINYMMPGSGQPWKQQYQINTILSTDITNWTGGASLPGVIGSSQAIVTKNRVYLLGGYTGASGQYVSTVYTAPINADGTLGTWTTGTSLPNVLGYSRVIVTKNRVYLLGGWNGSAAVSIVYTATINADGTIGSWTAGTSLPSSLYATQAVVTRNRVYLLGGSTGSSWISTVYTAPINSDGTIGTWSTSTALPGILGESSAFITKNRVYLCGGYNGTSWVSTVYTAPINADGTLGTWTTGTSLPITLGLSQAYVTKNRVYLFSGWNGSAYVSTVYTAPINADGTLGTWVTGTPLPGSLGNSQVIATKNNIYLLGGITGAGVAVATVYTAAIYDGLNDYSPYYDGTIVPVSTDSLKFKLPDYTLADREFGSLVTSYIKY